MLVAAVAVVAADPPLANTTIEYEEAIPKLLFADMQQEDEEKVAAAVTKLADLLNKSNANWDVNSDQALSVGVIAIILLLMRKWHHNRSIQLHGCCVLMRLTNNGYVSRQVDAAKSIHKSGGIETIMAAMKSFPDDDEIQRKGCRAIGNAFTHCPDRDSEPAMSKAMARFVGKLNGIELVVSVMKKFQNNAAVQQMCLYVLQQVSRERGLRDALKNGGALSAVGEAKEKHDDIDSLQSDADAFFKNM